VLERPIKETGAHEVEIKLHHDVVAKLNLNVKSSSKQEGPAEGAAAAEADQGEHGFRSKEAQGAAHEVEDPDFP